jgi:hypothetical protein
MQRYPVRSQEHVMGRTIVIVSAAGKGDLVTNDQVVRRRAGVAAAYHE